MKEYELLRNEMMEDYKAITQYNTVLYTAVATILTFALPREEFYLCMVPYLVIVPLYLMAESKRMGICRMAAYMNVFLEGGEYNWERRHHELDKKRTRSRGSLLPYFFLAAACTAASIYKVICSDYDCSAKWIITFIILVVTGASWIVMKNKTVNYTKTRERMIKDWEGIQITEKQEKRQEENACTN